MRLPLSNELLWSEVAERLVRTDGVVGAFPGAELTVEFRHGPAIRRDFVKLFVVGAVGAFDRAVEFGRARREHEQGQSAGLAGLLELGRELAAAVDLQRGDGKGHAPEERSEELRSGLGGSLQVDLNDIPAGDHVASREVLQEDAARWTHLFGVEFDPIAGLPNGPKPRLASGPGATTQPPPLAPEHRRSRWLDQHTAALEIGQDAPDQRSRNAGRFAPQQNGELVLAPARVVPPQSEDPFGQLGRPGGLASPVRAV